MDNIDEVELAQNYTERVGALRREQERLREALETVGGSISYVKKYNESPPQDGQGALVPRSAEDALAMFMTETGMGMAKQEARLHKLKVDSEKVDIGFEEVCGTSPEAFNDGVPFSQRITKAKISNAPSVQLVDGCTPHFVHAKAVALVDDWRKIEALQAHNGTANTSAIVSQALITNSLKEIGMEGHQNLSNKIEQRQDGRHLQDLEYVAAHEGVHWKKPSSRTETSAYSNSPGAACAGQNLLQIDYLHDASQQRGGRDGDKQCSGGVADKGGINDGGVSEGRMGEIVGRDHRSGVDRQSNQRYGLLSKEVRLDPVQYRRSHEGCEDYSCGDFCQDAERVRPNCAIFGSVKTLQGRHYTSILDGDESCRDTKRRRQERGEERKVGSGDIGSSGAMIPPEQSRALCPRGRVGDNDTDQLRAPLRNFGDGMCGKYNPPPSAVARASLSGPQGLGEPARDRTGEYSGMSTAGQSISDFTEVPPHEVSRVNARSNSGGKEPSSTRKWHEEGATDVHKTRALTQMGTHCDQKEELRQLVFQIQRLELEQRLEQMRESIIREKESRKQNAAYEQWITEQKRNLEVIKMEKMLVTERRQVRLQRARSASNDVSSGGDLGHTATRSPGMWPEVIRENEGDIAPSRAATNPRLAFEGIAQRPYKRDEGFCVFWDYLVGLPKRREGNSIARVRLVFGLYIGKRLQGKVNSTQWTDLAFDSVQNDATGRTETCAPLETRSLFAGVPPNAQARLVVEVQSQDGGGTLSQGAGENLGWGSIHVFKPEREDPQKLTVRVGLTRLTIFPGHVDLSMTNVNDDMSALSRSTPISTFMRLVHGEDISSAAAFTVDPDMRHVYVGYGRGTLAQMERRRLMAGTFLRTIALVGRLKRLVRLNTRDKQHGGVAEDTQEPPSRQRIGATVRYSTPPAPTAYPSTREPDKRQPNVGNSILGGDLNRDDMAPRDQKRGIPASVWSRNSSTARDYVKEDGKGRDARVESNEESKAGEGGDDVAPRPEKNSHQKMNISSLHALLAAKVTMGEKAGLSRRRRNMVSGQHFRRGDRFEFFLDAGMGMPYCCTVTRAVVKVLRMSGKQDLPEVTSISQAGSLSNNPIFALREEFRAESNGRMDITSIIMIRLDTVERSSKEHRAVGYALVPVFMDSSGEQPTDPAMERAFLREGNFQIPLHRGPPPDMHRITAKSLENIPRVPCASVLVRVKQAQKSADGKVVNKSDLSHNERRKHELEADTPEFAPGVYENSELTLTDPEKDILDLRSKEKGEETVFQASKLIKSPEDPGPGFVKDHAFADWAESLMSKKKISKMIDYSRAEKYRPERGFSVCVAGLVNMKSRGAFKAPRLYKVIYSLLTPGSYYGDAPKPQEIGVTFSYDLRSHQAAPRFQDPPHIFTHQKITSSQCIVIDVRFLEVNSRQTAAIPEKPNAAISSGAWGILPAFVNGDLAIGSFMVPLLSGRFPTHLLSAEDPIRFLLDRAMEKHPSYRPLEGSSGVVQICNALLKDVLPSAVQDPALNYVNVKRLADATRLQQDKYEFEFISDAKQKCIERLVPKGYKGRQQDFFTDANIRFATASGISHLLEQSRKAAR